jgi:hypothetical protein
MDKVSISLFLSENADDGELCLFEEENEPDE